MKKILLALAFILTLTTVRAQYYICPSDSVTGWLPLMEQSLGNPNISPRYNIAQDEAIMKFTVALAPDGSGLRYTASEIRVVLQTAAWDTTSPEPIESEERIVLAREYGSTITNAFFTRIDRNVYDATWTTGQGANAYANYTEVFGLIDEGLFDLVVKLEAGGQIVPQGVVTQQMIDSLIAKLSDWEANHPRP